MQKFFPIPTLANTQDHTKQQTKQPSDREIKLFSRFVTKLKTYVEDIDLDYDACADHPLYNHLEINFSFSMEEEARAYELIRRVRDCLSQSIEHPDNIEERFPVAVSKQWIASASCWSVTFYFSDEWKFKETLDFTFSNHYPVASVDEHQNTIASLESSYQPIEIIEDIVNMYDYATEQQKKDAIDECLRTSDMENINIEHLHRCAKSYSVHA